MLERPGRNKAYFNTVGMVKIRFIPPRPNSELYAFFRPGQSMVIFFCERWPKYTHYAFLRFGRT